MSKPSEKPRKVLGKGLSALLPARSSGTNVAPNPEPALAPRPAKSTISISLIDPNPLQPRNVFNAGKLRELSASIEVNGIIQPLILRRKGGRFELVAGERRLRAAREAGLAEVPAVVQDIADDQMLELALIENIQREDLNPIETAQALDRLVRDRGISHEELGRRTGKDRTTITNLVRLLKLPAEVQILVAENRITMGHARAILGIPSVEEQKALANLAAAQGYSVRQVERAVQQIVDNPESAGKQGLPANTVRVDPNVAAAVADLESALGTRVRIVEKTGQRGRIEIEYYSQDDLQRLYETIVAGVQPG